MIVKNDISLKPYHTFGVNAKARYFTEIASLSDLKEALLFVNKKKVPLLILGGGSNVLFVGDFEGLVLLNRMQGMKTVKETNEHLWVKVMSGQSWPDWIDYCVERGLGGVENLSMIPGTVGAAPIQNIGAYGAEVKEAIESVEAFDLNKKVIRTFWADECTFNYRSSIFKTVAKGKYFIISVTFKLIKNPTVKLSYAPLKKMFEGRNIHSVSIKEVCQAVKQIRKSKLPNPEVMGNAGSFFKNPVIDEIKLKKLQEHHPNIPYYPVGKNQYKLAAGWMIEQCNLKGKRIGDAEVHTKQALVIINHGSATGKEILKLAMEIINSVKHKFGVLLQFEVNIV